MEHPGRVLVVLVAAEPDGSDVVHFECAAGSGRALWCGGEPVTAGQSVHVEVDHTRPLTWVTANELTDGSGSPCRLVATVEASTESSVLVLRLGDGLLLATVADGERTATEGASVVLRDVELSLWPSGV